LRGWGGGGGLGSKYKKLGVASLMFYGIISISTLICLPNYFIFLLFSFRYSPLHFLCAPMIKLSCKKWQKQFQTNVSKNCKGSTIRKMPA
jgi:hypothetical protein